MEIVFVIIAVIAIAAVLFCFWLFVEVARGVGRFVVWIAAPFNPKPKAAAVEACDNPDCRGDNPAHARFCRRCGRALPALMRLVDARAA